MNPRLAALIDTRRDSLEHAVGKPLPPRALPSSEPLKDTERHYLRDEALDLYWNELEWEHITEEERLDEGSLTELAFPGFLAFVRGLLLRQALPDAGVAATPRPEVVEDLIEFLAGRVLALQEEEAGSEDEEEAEKARVAGAMTGQLLDLVLLQLHGVSPGDL